MDDQSRNLLLEVRRLADELGPALVPTGHSELMRSITEAARRLFQAAACSVALLDNDDTELVFHIASGEGAGSVEGIRMPASQGIAGWVVVSGQPIAIEDVRSDPRFASDVAESTGYTPKSILAMPLDTERRTIGVISVLDRSTAGRQGTNDMEILGLFARQAALAIENSRVFTELGGSLFKALSAAAEDAPLREALLSVAGESNGTTRELAELAAHFYALSAMGDTERAAAVGLLGEFLSYVTSRRKWA